MVASFLESQGILFDVRSPLEYKQGHIPGAINLPLFSDEERALVGTVYKKNGQKTAIELGVKLVGPKLYDLLERAKCSIGEQKKLRIYCYRGGMRSSFVSWFLGFLGYQTVVLQGGYKAFRYFVLHYFDRTLKLSILGGLTGSGKTKILEEFARDGAQVLDLEKLAKHRGSAFGLSPNETQPTNEQFENELVITIHAFRPEEVIWVEDESRQIGKCVIPHGLFTQMREATLFELKISLEERIQNLVTLYGGYPIEYLIESCMKITKRLGGARSEEVIAAIHRNDLETACRTLLAYYDHRYNHSLLNRSGPICVYTY